MRTIGLRIRRIRAARGKSQQVIAGLIGIYASTLRHIEHGRRAMTPFRDRRTGGRTADRPGQADHIADPRTAFQHCQAIDSEPSPGEADRERRTLAPSSGAQGARPAVRDSHVDHLYLDLTPATPLAPDAELPFAWYTIDQLDTLDRFNDTRARATYLLYRIDTLSEATAYDRTPVSWAGQGGGA